MNAASAERIERRVLGAVRLVDANTRQPIARPLSVSAAGVRFVRNGRGLYVIAGAAGLEAHARAFDAPPAQPPLRSLAFTLRVADPGGRYLPRLAALELPRDPDPAHRDSADSLFRPHDVALLPTPAGEFVPGWAVIRARVEGADGAPRGGALLRVLRAGNGGGNGEEVLARGLTEWRGHTAGEALVGVPGIPVTTFGAEVDEDAPVVVTEIDVQVEAVFDPALDLSAADAAPDPDALEANRAALVTARVPARLASGRTLALRMEI